MPSARIISSPDGPIAPGGDPRPHRPSPDSANAFALREAFARGLSDDPSLVRGVMLSSIEALQEALITGRLGASKLSGDPHDPPGYVEFVRTPLGWHAEGALPGGDRAQRAVAVGQLVAEVECARAVLAVPAESRELMLAVRTLVSSADAERDQLTNRLREAGEALGLRATGEELGNYPGAEVRAATQALKQIGITERWIEDALARAMTRRGILLELSKDIERAFTVEVRDAGADTDGILVPEGLPLFYLRGARALGPEERAFVQRL